jgi:tetratricopeptide (TPR) repeat protein
MTAPDRDFFARVEELFAGALDLPPQRRDEFLAAACGEDSALRREVESLLAASARGGDFLAEPFELAATGPEGVAPPDREIGRVIRNYRLVSRIGEGGMGKVYLGERVGGDFEQRVAIKLLRRDPFASDLERRFRRERQVLASLAHPNIPRLLDAGATDDGLPFLVIEYVEGEPITRYCDRRQLPTRERIQLFRQVCAAVAYAHRRLVVHRDLKPDNVLVSDDGEVRLLDFGISKILEAEDGTAPTQTIDRRLTPAYASPEQVRGDPVTTASDVYSLGVLLHELLTSKLPYRFGAGTTREVERAVLEQEPVVPQHGLDADLELVVRAALRKEPERRYPSADALADDLHRWLERMPIKARPDSIRYRVARFVSRHRALVASLLALTIASLAGTAVSTHLWLDARREAQRAKHAETLAEARLVQVRTLTRRAMVEVQQTIESLPGADRARGAMIEVAIDYLDLLGAGEDPGVDALREQVLGYRSVARLIAARIGGSDRDARLARAVHDKLGAAALRLLAIDPEDEAATGARFLALEGEGATFETFGRLDDAERKFRLALELAVAWIATKPSSFEATAHLLTANGRLGALARRRGDAKSSLEHHLAILPLAEELLVEAPQDPTLLHNLALAAALAGKAHLDLGDHESAATLLERARDTARDGLERFPRHRLLAADLAFVEELLATATPPAVTGSR